MGWCKVDGRIYRVPQIDLGVTEGVSGTLEVRLEVCWFSRSSPAL